MNLLNNLTACDYKDSESFKLSIDTDKIIAINEENFPIIDDFLREVSCEGSGILIGNGQYYFVMKPYNELIELINGQKEKPPELGVLMLKFVDKKLNFEAVAYVKHIDYIFKSQVTFTSKKYEAMKLTEEEAKEYPSFNWVSLKEEMP